MPRLCTGGRGPKSNTTFTSICGSNRGSTAAKNCRKPQIYRCEDREGTVLTAIKMVTFRHLPQDIRSFPLRKNIWRHRGCLNRRSVKVVLATIYAKLSIFIILYRIKSFQRGDIFFVKWDCRYSTAILSVGIKYSMRDGTWVWRQLLFRSRAKMYYGSCEEYLTITHGVQ